MKHKIVSPILIVLLTVGVTLALGCTTTIQTQTTATTHGTQVATATPIHTPSLTGSIVQRGSDTLLPLAQLYAENFMNNNTGVNIQVAGGGSGVGITALIEGTTDIADASRQMKSSERANAQNRGVNPVEWKVALDGITIIVHPSNPVSDLTITQLGEIYKGNITNWNQLGGPNLPIVLFGRQSTSGTYEFFKEHILSNKNFSAAVQEQTGTAQIAEQVARSPGGIGYGGVGYFATRTDVKILSLNGSLPSVANINSGVYPLWRYLYHYTDGIPSATGSNPALFYYLSYILSLDGQALNDNVEYLPLQASTLNEMRTQLPLPPA